MLWCWRTCIMWGKVIMLKKILCENGLLIFGSFNNFFLYLLIPARGSSKRMDVVLGSCLCHMLVWHLMILACHGQVHSPWDSNIYTYTQILDRSLETCMCWKKSHVRQNGRRKKQMYVGYIVEWGAHQMLKCIRNDTRINVKELYEWECWVKNIMLKCRTCDDHP